MRRAVSALVASSVFVASSCFADGFDALRGLKAIRVVADISSVGRPEDVGACGLTEASVKIAAEFALQQSRLKLVEANAAQATFYVLVILIPIRTTDGALPACAYALDMGLTGPVTGKTSWGGNVIRAPVYRALYAGSGSPPISAPVSQAVTDQTKGFVVEWAKVN